MTKDLALAIHGKGMKREHWVVTDVYMDAVKVSRFFRLLLLLLLLLLWSNPGRVERIWVTDFAAFPFLFAEQARQEARGEGEEVQLVNARRVSDAQRFTVTVETRDEYHLLRSRRIYTTT